MLYENKIQIQLSPIYCKVLFGLGCLLSLCIVVGNDQVIQSFLFFTYLYCLFWKDAKTYYLSKGWIFPSVLLLILFIKDLSLSSSLIGAFLYGIPSLVIYLFHKEWIGIADVFFFFFFGVLLGYQRMMIACLISIGIAFIWSFFSHQKTIPYLSCLSIGIVVAYLKGYMIFGFILHSINAF